MLAILHPHSSNYLNAGLVGKPHGNSHPMIAPYDLIATADRPIFLPSGNDGQWRRLAEVIGRPELGEDPRFRTNQDRVAHRRELLDGRRGRLPPVARVELCRRRWDAGASSPARSIRSPKSMPTRRWLARRCSSRSPTRAVARHGPPGRLSVKLGETPPSLAATRRAWASTPTRSSPSSATPQLRDRVAPRRWRCLCA